MGFCLQAFLNYFKSYFILFCLKEALRLIKCKPPPPLNVWKKLRFRNEVFKDQHTYVLTDGQTNKQ